MSTLVNHVKNSTGFGESTIAAVIDSAVVFLANSLRNGESVKLEGLGTFKFTDKPEREGRNPRTGQMTIFRASRRIKLVFSKNFVTSIQPDPNVELSINPVEAEEVLPQSKSTTPPPIPAELLAVSQPKTTQLWQIKAPDDSFVDVSTNELTNWGVTQTTPIYSPATGWKLAGQVPELAGIVV